MSKIYTNDFNDTFEQEKEITKLIHKMEDGEITEDDFNEEVEKIKRIIERKDKEQLVDIELSEKNPNKKENESYSNYFGNHKKEFRNILGI